MKIIRYLLLASLMTPFAQGVELQRIEDKVLLDQRNYIRESADLRCNIWTDDQVKATKILDEFGLVVPRFELRSGQILAVFFNDHITEDLVQITYNQKANGVFADYADSGVRFKLRGLEEEKKYSHVTVVIFKPMVAPSRLGLRGMIPDGLSEKR